MDCSLLPDEEPCNHFNRPWTIETPPTPIEMPHNTMQPTQFYGQPLPTCQNCQCSDEFVNLNRRFGAEHEMFAINSVSARKFREHYFRSATFFMNGFLRWLSSDNMSTIRKVSLWSFFQLTLSLNSRIDHLDVASIWHQFVHVTAILM